MDKLVRKAEEIMRAGDQIIEKKKRMGVMIRRITASSAGLCTIIAVYVFTLKNNILFLGNHNSNDEIIINERDTIISESVPEKATTVATTQTFGSTATNITTSISSTNNSATSVTNSSTETHIVTDTKMLLNNSDISTFTTTNYSDISITASTIITTNAESMQLSISSSTITTTTNLSFGEEIDSFIWGDIEYNVTNKDLIDDKVLGDKISNTDIETQSGIITADIHEINGISPNYAVIVRMDSTSELMTGVNNAYLPVTLHSLFEDIGLNDYWKTDNKDFDILEKLLQLPDCPLEQFVSPGKSIKDYEIECELLSVSDTLISLTEKGYLIFSQNGNSFVFWVDNNIKSIIEGDSNEEY